jgi:putative iron-dependent peroxidase
MVPDPLPQPVTAPLTPAAIFLVVTIDEDGEAAVHDALPDISVPGVGFRDDSILVVTSIGSLPGTASSPVEASGLTRSSARGDDTTPLPPRESLFHIKALSMDMCFELAGRIKLGCGHRRQADARLPVVTTATYYFVDAPGTPGSARCPPPRLATRIDFAGGCYVHVQSTCTIVSLSRCRSPSRIGDRTSQAPGHRMDDDARPMPTSR